MLSLLPGDGPRPPRAARASAAARIGALATTILALAAGAAAAQGPSAAADSASSPAAGAPASSPRPAWSTEVWAAYGNNSTLALHLGEVAGVDYTFAAVGVSRRVAGGAPLELRFTADVLPVMAISGVSWDVVTADCPSGRQCRIPSGFGTSGTTMGVGAAPLGLEARVRLTGAARLYGGIRGGAAWFADEVPLDGGGRVHYFGGVGAGLRIDVAERAALRVGYEAHHLSNANTAPQNPGLDWHLLTVGLSWRVARPETAGASGETDTLQRREQP